jgi:glycosyltransferase involved in cell wall biosynthesis
MKPSVLVVIPAFNEEGSIARVLDGLRRHAPSFDRLVVNDGSQDGTGAIVSALEERQLQLSSNLGYGSAIQLGLKYALIRNYDIVVTIDADGQHRPEDVSRLVQTLIDDNVDMVIGSRFVDGRAYDTPFYRRMGQIIFSKTTSILVKERMYDTSSGFKVMRNDICKSPVNATFMDFHIETIVRLSMLGYTIKEVSVDVLERSAGESMHSFSSVFQYPLRTILLTLAAVMDTYIERRTR